MQANPRYAGKPLLRLLECYVLWAIDELPEKEASSLVSMTPKLQNLYKSDGQWQDIIAGTVDMDAEMPERLKVLWARNVEIAQQNGAALTPQQFAEMVVDDNFAG
ncbi:hypothetical protein [Allosphingosinicella deserti]|jgi:hypothetical protein|uniref:Uncharacterized protein n=1 Tax=Allosphingosinicella deserti TaxID=2116704 RepID=A0A2P7QW71_9SPHN|nr:hypothetical protein [Sphingomonas deserti]PSJ42189.1 hypothetical protein C7I55_08115 [Sphingomonas deserti]